MTDPLLGILCGNVPARNFTSTGNALFITFQSDSTTEKRGFKLTVTNVLQSKISVAGAHIILIIVKSFIMST